MRRERKITYLTLALAVLTLTACLVSGMTDANARVVTVSGWQMELTQKPNKKVLSSNVLEKGNTVVLEDLSVSQTRDFTVSVVAEGGTVSGRLGCTTDDYLVAQCSERQDDFTNAEFTITLTPTEEAMALMESVTSVVTVKWNDNLWANFQVKLLPDETLVAQNEDETQDDSGTDIDAGTEESEPQTAETVPPDLSQLSMATDFVSGMTAFDQNELLVLGLTIPATCNRIELGLDSNDFPAMTRYSLDGGATYITLYDAQPLVIEPGQAQAITLLLDMKAVTLASTSMTVYAYAYYDEVSRGTAKYDLSLLEPLRQLGTDGKLIVLNENIPFTTSFPWDIGGARAEMTLARLDGTTDRMPYVTQDDLGAVIIQTTGDGPRAGAGAYQLTVKWTYSDVLVAQRELVFYVNYSDYVRN